MEFDQERTGTWLAYGVGQLPFGNGETGPTFADRLAARFPQVAGRIDQADFGQLNLEVGALKLATRDAILKGDWPTVQSHLAFVDELLESASPDLHEAIGIYYLVNLFYGETSPDFAKARSMMPRRLGIALEIMERHYEELS